MGQAKNRGNFEERQSKAITVNQERKEALERVRAINEANMTPEQRKSRRHAQNFMAIAAGLSIGGFGGF